jgi:multidrug efflux system outer membrane protein
MTTRGLKNYQIIIAATALLSSGCAVGPDYVPPEILTPESFSGAAEVSSACPSDKPARVDWWASFNDPELQKLINAAVAENRSIDQAVARLNEVRAALSEAKTDILPSVTFDSQYQRLQSSRETEFQFGPRTYKEAFAGFDASWELDFFGLVRRNLEETQANKERANAQLDDALVTVVAEVARNYIQLRGDQRRLEVAENNLKNQEETVRLSEATYLAGASTKLENARAKAQRETIRSSIPPIQAAVRASMFRLAVLTGQAPETLIDELSLPAPLPIYDGPLTLTSPAEMIRRRPDVRSAERALAAATAEIGVYTALLFPRITFEGDFGYRGSQLERLGDVGSDYFIIGPRITWPAFELSKKWAEKLQADARAAQALAAYQETVLEALEDVENSMSYFSSARSRHRSLVAARDENRIALDLARLQYKSGSAAFIDVLDAERSLYLSEDQVAESETELVTRLIAIYKSLGGGWDYWQRTDNEVLAENAIKEQSVDLK